MTRATILFYRLGPYHLARLRAAAASLEVVAIEYAHQDSTYAWDVVQGADGFRRVTLFPDDGFERERTAAVPARVGQALQEAKPEVVAIPGWGDRCSRAALNWCAQHGVPAVVMIESIADYKEPRVWWKESVKRQLVALSSAALVGGRTQADYGAALGLPREHMFDGYDVVDNAHFASLAEAARHRMAAGRTELGLPEHYFLATARFVEDKNLSRLLQAYACYRERAAATAPATAPWHLVLLGDGPLKERLGSEISSLGLRDSVLLPGFKQYDELPAYYALAGAFILPSVCEMWGLVVNEALACGLPVLVSDRCGCAPDLVQEGRNGFTFDPYDVAALTLLMQRLAGLTPGTRSDMGVSGRRLIASWGPERFGRGMQAAVEKALQIGPRRASLWQRAVLKALAR